MGNLKKSSEDIEIKRKLNNSSIYADFNQIINAYNKETELESDELFTANGKFSLSKFSDARKLISSGAFDKEIDNLQNKLNNHKYFLQKNELKDRENLQELTTNYNKIKLFSSLLDTKRDWYSILDNNLPNQVKIQMGENCLSAFVEECKNLNHSIEKSCLRHRADDDFAKKLNDMLEMSAKSDSELEDGGEVVKFAILLRKDFINSLKLNYNKNFEKGEFSDEFINEKF